MSNLLTWNVLMKWTCNRIEKFEVDGLPWVVSLLTEHLSPFYQRAARESLAVLNCLG